MLLFVFVVIVVVIVGGCSGVGGKVGQHWMKLDRAIIQLCFRPFHGSAVYGFLQVRFYSVLGFTYWWCIVKAM